MTSNRIALLFDRPYIDAHFCFREMVTQFCDHGWEVDLLMPFSVWHPVPTFNKSQLKIHFVNHNKAGLLKLLWKLSCIGSRKYRAIIATPQWALYWSVRIGKLRNIPVVCLPDECYTWDKNDSPMTKELTPSSQSKWKKREVWAHHQCALSIALGEWWFSNVIKKENSLPDNHPYVLVPNAPAGPATSLKSSYYREVLDIPASKKILLYSGDMKFNFVKALLDEAFKWRNRWCIAFQGRYYDHLDGLQESPNVRFSKNVLPAEIMRYATSSADIGLMLYNRDIPAEARNGSEAGKLGLYLSCGLPIICCNSDVLRWIEEEGCGAWVRNLSAIPEAADRIMNDYETFSRNARRVFDEKFEYSKHFKVFLNKLESLSNTSE